MSVKSKAQFLLALLQRMALCILLHSNCDKSDNKVSEMHVDVPVKALFTL